MSKVKYTNKVFRLKYAEAVKLAGLPEALNFKSGEEFHIVADVVYMNGFILPPGMQSVVFNWIDSNQNKFVDDTRQF